MKTSNSNKHGLTIRGDSLYCPLSFQLDTYNNCLTDCWQCYFRRLNHVWGKQLNPVNPEALHRKLVNGLKNPNPKSSLAWAIKGKKVLRLGNKVDAFQRVEQKMKVTEKCLDVLGTLDWPLFIQTKFTTQLLKNLDRLADFSQLWVLSIISCGLEKDWEILERKRTVPVEKRLKHLNQLRDELGITVGVNGEPFIPGYHTTQDFERTMKLLNKWKITSYNVYNFHWNDFIAKRLVALGIDIERIWHYNRDEPWKKILLQLIEIAKKYNIDLGCPDFVNSGGAFYQTMNTCCGLEVTNPTTFNTHVWKRMVQEGRDKKEILKETWDGVGDYDEGEKVLFGKKSDFYTFKDIDGL